MSAVNGMSRQFGILRVDYTLQAKLVGPVFIAFTSVWERSSYLNHAAWHKHTQTQTHTPHAHTTRTHTFTHTKSSSRPKCVPLPGLDISVSAVTRLRFGQLTYRGWILSRYKTSVPLAVLPDWLCLPPRALANAYRGLLDQGKAAGACSRLIASI